MGWFKKKVQDLVDTKEKALDNAAVKLHRVEVDNNLLKEFIVKQIQKLPDDDNTRRFMLYMINVFDNPQVLEADIVYIENERESNRASRDIKSRVKSTLWLLLGLGVAGILTWLISTFGGVLGF